MPKASVKRLIECKKEKLIDLILDIEKYPDFVPYCLESKIYEKTDKKKEISIIADLTIGKGLFVDTYKSDVRYNKIEDTIYVTNLDGPLEYLKNKWIFRQAENSTEISFEVDFELKNKFLNIIMTTSFRYGLDKVADAFETRAYKIIK